MFLAFLRNPRPQRVDYSINEPVSRMYFKLLYNHFVITWRFSLESLIFVLPYSAQRFLTGSTKWIGFRTNGGKRQVSTLSPRGRSKSRFLLSEGSISVNNRRIKSYRETSIVEVLSRSLEEDCVETVLRKSQSSFRLWDSQIFHRRDPPSSRHVRTELVLSFNLCIITEHPLGCQGHDCRATSRTNTYTHIYTWHDTHIHTPVN